MDKVALACVLCVCAALVSAQSIEDLVRGPEESPADFVRRVIPPDNALTYEILETDEWDAADPSIMAFYQTPFDYGRYPEVIGHLYMRQYGVDYYRDIVFGDFIGESNYPEILDVFYLNLDRDQERELLVLYRVFLRHYDFTGYVYDVAAFDNPTVLSDSLELLPVFGNAFVSFEGNNGEGLESIPRYADRDSIIEGIREMREANGPRSAR